MQSMKIIFLVIQLNYHLKNYLNIWKIAKLILATALYCFPSYLVPIVGVLLCGAAPKRELAFGEHGLNSALFVRVRVRLHRL